MTEHEGPQEASRLVHEGPLHEARLHEGPHEARLHEARLFHVNISQEDQQLANSQLTPPKPQVVRKMGINKSALKTPRVGRENYDQVIFHRISFTHKSKNKKENPENRKSVNLEKIA